MSRRSVQMGWLDLADEDQRRARDYLASFRTGETVDELGFGIMRDALADRFFPATNTIMTRTRYLIFVPALYLRVERERLYGSRAASRMTELENDLRQRLDQPTVEGVIGRRAKETLARFPSSIYWNALKHLGIYLRATWSQSYYHDHLRQFYDDSAVIRDDDGLGHITSPQARNWDAPLEDLASSIVDNPKPDFELTTAESRYLRDRFIAVERPQPSLLLHLLRHRYTQPFDYPWELKECPDSLVSVVKQAEFLSILARGATLQYYQMVLDAKRRAGLAAPQCEFDEAFGLWWMHARDRLDSWNLEEFFLMMRGLNAMRPCDREFFVDWLRALLASRTASGLFNSGAARDLIQARERVKRPRKSRLAGGDQLRSWNPPDNLDGKAFTDPVHVRYQLDYRSGIGGTFVREISQGLGRRA